MKGASLQFFSVALGFLLHAAGVSKLVSPDGVLLWITGIPAVGHWPHATLAIFTALEFAVGWMLMLGFRPRLAAGLALALIACFTMALLAWPPSGTGCACFGGLARIVESVNPVARNAALGAVAYLLWRFSPEECVPTDDAYRHGFPGENKARTP
jgi:uncharacterized membrane protein YphA (DoxX/SURF4 family)